MKSSPAPQETSTGIILTSPTKSTEENFSTLRIAKIEGTDFVTQFQFPVTVASTSLSSSAKFASETTASSTTSVSQTSTNLSSTPSSSLENTSLDISAVTRSSAIGNSDEVSERLTFVESTSKTDQKRTSSGTTTTLEAPAPLSLLPSKATTVMSPTELSERSTTASQETTSSFGPLSLLSLRTRRPSKTTTIYSLPLKGSN